MSMEDSSDEEIAYSSSDDEVWEEEDFLTHQMMETILISPHPMQDSSQSYGDFDSWKVSSLQEFQPCRPPGAHLPDSTTREACRKYVSALSMFQLFFSSCIIQQLCDYTNRNAEKLDP